MTERKKPTHRIYFHVRALVTRCHLNYKGTIPLYISALSNNKLHCKVCAPNFHCFKFIFSNQPNFTTFNHLFTITTGSLKIKNSYFSDLLRILYAIVRFLSRFFIIFFQNRGFLQKFSPKSERCNQLLHRLILYEEEA